MLLAYAVAAVTGFLVGLRYKVGAVALVSVAVVLGGTAAGMVADWPLWWAFLAAFGGAAVIQAGYLLGLAVNCAASRAAYSTRAEGTFPRHLSAAEADPTIPAP